MKLENATGRQDTPNVKLGWEGFYADQSSTLVKDVDVTGTVVKGQQLPERRSRNHRRGQISKT